MLLFLTCPQKRVMFVFAAMEVTTYDDKASFSFYYFSFLFFYYPRTFTFLNNLTPHWNTNMLTFSIVYVQTYLFSSFVDRDSCLADIRLQITKKGNTKVVIEQ